MTGLDGGQNFYDLTGAAHGTLTSMGNSSNGWRYNNHFGGQGCLLFDGTAGYVDCGNIAAVDNLTNMTVACWVNLTGQSGFRNIVTKISNLNTGIGWAVFIDASHLAAVIQVSGSQYQQVETVPNYPAGDWHHVVWSKTGNTNSGWAIYVDGSSIALSPTSGGAAIAGFSTSAPVRFATDGNGGNLWNGSLDDIRIWKRAFSANEAKGLYDNSVLGCPGLLNRVPLF